MNGDELRVSVGGTVTRPREEVVAGYEIISAELEQTGVAVDDKGPVTTEESTDQILEYVVKIATDPGVHTFVGTGAALAGKALLQAGGNAAAKAVIEKIANSGKARFSNIFKSLEQRFPGRKAQILIDAPNGVTYPLHADNAPDEAFAEIASDMVRERATSARMRFYDDGQWMTPDEVDEARKKKRTSSALPRAPTPTWRSRTAQSWTSTPGRGAGALLVAEMVRLKRRQSRTALPRV